MEESLDPISCCSIEALEIDPLASEDLNFRVSTDESINLMCSKRFKIACLDQRPTRHHNDLLMRGRKANRVLDEYPAGKALFLILEKPLLVSATAFSCS
jgi:hypothetical protein